MTTQTKEKRQMWTEKSQLVWLARFGLCCLFLVGETLIFIFGAHYFDVFPTNKNLTFNLIVSVGFLIIALWFRFSQKLKAHWRIPFAFFIASIVFPLTALLDPVIRSILGWFNETASTTRGIAIEKVSEALIKSVSILLLVKLSGADFGSVFLSRGDFKLQMGISWLVFFFVAPTGFMFAAQRFTSMEALVTAFVWGLVFSSANSFMEELWLRGVFLKRFEPLIGINAAVWVTSLIFAAMHSFSFYFMPAAIPFFFINTLALGLGCGYLMMKSDSLWGPVIIHAASDFVLFIALLSNA